jgi:(p)ppGpp synthase/HD superfamily hydrolase
MTTKPEEGKPCKTNTLLKKNSASSSSGVLMVLSFAIPAIGNSKGYNMLLVESARDFGAIAHSGQMRRCGSEPYFNHSQRVAKAVEELCLSDEAVAAALLHDVVEDTAVTLSEILLQFGDRVAELVDLLSKRKDEDGDEAIQRLVESKDREALWIKLCDLEDNSVVLPHALWDGWEKALSRYAKRKVLVIKALQQL